MQNLLFNQSLATTLKKIKDELGIPKEDVRLFINKESISVHVDDRVTQYHQGGYALIDICEINKEAEFHNFKTMDSVHLNRDRGYKLPVGRWDLTINFKCMGTYPACSYYMEIDSKVIPLHINNEATAKSNAIEILKEQYNCIAEAKQINFEF